MALVKQSTAFNFLQGLDTKTDPKQVVLGRFLSLKNTVFTKAGLLQKRNGFNALGSSVVNNAGSLLFSNVPANVSAGANLATFQNELVLMDGMNAYSYDQSALSWIYKGRATTCKQTITSVNKDANSQSMPDSAANSTLGVNVFAWQDDTKGGIYCNVVDAATSQVIYPAKLLTGTGTMPRVVSLGAKVYIFYVDVDNKIHLVTYSGSGFSASSPVVLNLNTTTPTYDAQVLNGAIYLAYYSTTPDITLLELNSSGGIVATISVVENASGSLSIFGDSSNLINGNVWTCYSDGTNVKAFAVDSGLTTQVVTPTLVDTPALAPVNVTGVYLNGEAVIFYDTAGPLTQSSTSWGATQSIGTPLFTQPAVGSTVAVNGPFSIGINGKNIYLDTGGFYQVVGYSVLSLSPPDAQLTLKNLGNVGIPSNVAPGSGVPGISNGHGYGANLYSAVTAYPQTLFNTVTPGASGNPGTPGTAALFLNQAGLFSKAFVMNGVANVCLVHSSTLQSTYFLCNLYNAAGTPSLVPNANIAAKILADSAGGLPSLPLLRAVNVANQVVQFAVQQKDLLFTTSTPNGTTITYTNTGISSAAVDFGATNQSQVTLGKNLHFGSGDLLMYDGQNVVEHGFHLYPENIVAIATTGGGLNTGQYGYQVTYEWTDNQGQVHQSAPSPIVSVAANTSTANAFNVIVPYLGITAKRGVNVVLWRTTVNGTTYYRTSLVSQPTPNDPSQSTVTFYDYLPDPSISGNQQLYTEAAVENIAAPGSSSFTQFKNRLILLPSEDPYSFWYSKQVIPGSPVEFSDLFVQNVGTADGPIVAVAAMDDKIILLKQNSLYYVTGTGPSPSGANNDFSDATFITSDAGCVDAGSVVNSPAGLFFKSSKGIYLLGRDLSVHYIGAPVEGFNQYTVENAVLVPNTNQMRFALNGGQGSLMYDYFFNQWSQHTTPAAVAAVIFQNAHTFLGSNGSVYKEAQGVYQDGSTTPAFNVSFTTSWITLAGIQGYERMYFFYLLGTYLSPHQLTISIAYDYNPSPTQTQTITPSNALTNTLEQWKFHLQRQTAEAIQITLAEVPGSPPDASFNLSGLNFTFALKKGWKPIPAAYSTG